MLGSSRTRVPAALSSRPERISMTPRTPNTPYVRPQFPTSGGTRPPTGPGSQPADGNSQARQQLGDARGTLEMQQKIFDEVRRGREERRSIREEIRKVAQQVSKLEEQQKKLMEMAKQQNDASFTIETSVYKADLLKEVGMLFTKSLERKLSNHDIGQAIIKVLQNDGRNKMKFNKARTFSFNRLTDLRCEERRRIFGIKPCQTFPTLTTEEFTDRFLATIKAPDEVRGTYVKHLALLRKFAREVPEAKNDTFKRFREWLQQVFAVGCPTEEEWGQIMVDDNNYQYHQPYVDPAYDSNSLVERNGEYPDPEEDYSPGSNDGAYDGYNPEMHTFANGTE